MARPVVMQMGNTPEPADLCQECIAHYGNVLADMILCADTNQDAVKSNDPQKYANEHLRRCDACYDSVALKWLPHKSLAHVGMILRLECLSHRFAVPMISFHHFNVHGLTNKIAVIGKETDVTETTRALGDMAAATNDPCDKQFDTMLEIIQKKSIADGNDLIKTLRHQPCNGCLKYYDSPVSGDTMRDCKCMEIAGTGHVRVRKSIVALYKGKRLYFIEFTYDFASFAIFAGYTVLNHKVVHPIAGAGIDIFTPPDDMLNVLGCEFLKKHSDFAPMFKQMLVGC